MASYSAFTLFIWSSAQQSEKGSCRALAVRQRLDNYNNFYFLNFHQASVRKVILI